MNKISKYVILAVVAIILFIAGIWFGNRYGLPFQDSATQSSAMRLQDDCAGIGTFVGYYYDGRTRYTGCRTPQGTVELH